GQCAKIAERPYPPFVKFIGGDEKWIRMLEDRADCLKADEMEIVRAEVLLPKELHKANKELLTFVPLRVHLESRDGEFMWKDHLIVSSSDAGKTWQIMERGEWKEEEIRNMYPQLPKAATLPAVSKLEKLKELKDGIFISEKGNFKVTYSKEWKRLKEGERGSTLVLERDKQLLMVHGEESNTPAEEMLAEFVSMVKDSSKAPKEYRRDELK